jgi:hypothetical protein
MKRAKRPSAMVVRQKSEVIEVKKEPAFEDFKSVALIGRGAFGLVWLVKER